MNECDVCVIRPAAKQLDAARRGSARSQGVRFRKAVGTFVLLAALPLLSEVRAEVQIERLFLPRDASPSSFAIGLPGGINFCFDPVRGGVSYVWKGGFLDLSSTRPGPGKFIYPAKLLGPVVYEETGFAPLRRGESTRAPEVEFTGYALRADAIEFRYTVDGTPVREEVRANAAGTALISRLTIAGGADAKWWHVVEGKPATELKRESGAVLILERPLAPAP